jgi:transposase
MEVLIGVDPH